jgi:uridine phosphorylase
MQDGFHYEGTLSALEIFLRNNNVTSLAELAPAPENCILCPSSKLLAFAQSRFPLSEGPKIIQSIHLSPSNVGIFTGFVGFGSPMWAWIIEQLIAYGVKNFIFLGFVGRINPEISTDTVIVVTKACRDEGTSYHYTEASEWALPDSSLTQKLLSHTGTVGCPIWTTDAMFKQSQPKIDTALKADVVGFDMECSALFSVAQAKNCKIASLQVVSDSHIGGKWDPIYKTDTFNKTFEKAVSIAIDAFTIG